MWHEARRQERKIRGMLVDYRRRAERRRDFYEKIKADPTQFLQIHGRQCKVHLDQNVAAAADTAVMMPWQGQRDNLIDRFDVRAHLDYIPPVGREDEEKLTQDERHLNYERYRIIAQNSFLGIPEEKFLKQLHLEEQFGYTEIKTKKDSRSGAAIGFNYEDNTGIPQETVEESDDENSDSDLDVDLAINVSKMDPAQANEMNKHGRNYGMSSNDFYSFLINDLEEAEAVKLAREEEQEKALFSGRKSRRERRYHREKRLANRTISPPSYAAKASPTLPNFRDSKSKSRSRTPSPENSGKITYITSFGEDEETPSSSKPTFASKVKFGTAKPTTVQNDKFSSVIRRHSRSRSRSKDRYYSKNSRSRSSVSRKTKFRRSRTRSRSRRSASNSRSGYRRHRTRSSSSRSRSYSRSRSLSRKSSSRSRDRSRNFRRRHSTSSSSTSSKSSSRSSSSDSSIHNTPKKNSPGKSKTEQARNIQPVTDVIPRYYGRKKNDKSSSDLSDLNDDDYSKHSADYGGAETHTKDNLATASKKVSNSMTIIERLKRKRQALLNRQFKADKIAEQIKTERERLEQQTREDELREMAIKLRKRQREKRHANDSISSSDSDNSSNSNESKVSKTRSRSHSRDRQDVRKDRRSRRNSDNRRSNSRDRDRRRRDRDRNRDRRRWSPSPNRTSKDRYKDDRDKSKNTKLVNY